MSGSLQSPAGHSRLDGSPDLSIIIPAYNEERRLPRALNDVDRFMRESGIAYELIVVDDGSLDGTAKVVEKWQGRRHVVTLLRLPSNRGKGAAVKAGMLAATGRIRMFCDADQSTPIDQLPRLLAPLALDGFDVAIASRALRGSQVERPQAWIRQKLGVAFGLLAKTLLVRGYRDCQCGFKAFSQAAAVRIFPRLTCTNGLFDMEVMLLAAQAGLRVAEVPVRWRHDDDSRLTYGVKGAFGLVGELLRMRRHWSIRTALKADVTVQDAVMSVPLQPAAWAKSAE